MNPIHIKKANKGLLHKNLGIPQGEKIPKTKLMYAIGHSNPAVRRRAQFALNAKSFNH